MRNFLFLVLLFCLGVINISAESYTDDNGVIWTFNIENEGAYITSVENYPERLVVPKMKVGDVEYPVKVLGEYLFFGKTDLVSISGLTDCERIGYECFSRCSSLVSVGDLPKCTEIGDHAFSACHNLNTIGDLSKCNVIGEVAFRETGIAKINLSDSCVEIAQQAFCWCRNLQDVGDLSGCKIIGHEAFLEVPLKRVNLESCESIDNAAFSGCVYLRDIGNLSKCKYLSTGVFNGCAFESVNISGLTTLSAGVFNDCSSLKSVIGLSSITSIGNNAFNGCSSLHLDVDLSDCESIGSGAFNSVFGNITFNTSTPPTIISKETFGDLTILVPSSALETYRSADFWKEFKTKILPLDGIRDYDLVLSAKENSSDLNDQITEANLLNVQNLKLSGTINGYDIMIMRNKMVNLQNVDISDATIVSNDYEYVTGFHSEEGIIGSYSFSNLPTLKSIKLPRNITSIADNAFQNSIHLESVEIQDGLLSIGNGAFYGCSSLQSIVLPANLESIGSSAFDGCKELTTLVLPEGLKYLNENAFINCVKINNISFPRSLETIGNGAFNNCRDLDNLILSPTLKHIGSGAFYGCSSLTSIHIPPMVETIGDNAFGECNKITKIYTYVLSPFNIDQNTFSVYDKAQLYVYPSSYYLFYYNTQWSQFLNVVESDEEYTYENFYLNNDYTITDEKGVVEGTPNGDMREESGWIAENTQSVQTMNTLTSAQDPLNGKGASVIGDGEASEAGNETQSTVNIVMDNLNANIAVAAYRWYFFCFPYDINISECTYPGSYVWYKYDGEERANGNTGWTKLTENNDILAANTGYIFQSDTEGTLTVSFYKPTFGGDRPISIEAYVAPNISDASWNLIGNPYHSFYDLDQTTYNAPITVWNPINQTYEAYNPEDDDFHLQPYQAFFVQKPEDTNEVAFTEENRETYTQKNSTQASQAKARRVKGIKANRCLVNLTIGNGDQTVDHTRVVLNNAKTMGYDLGTDAAKFISNDAELQLYTLDTESKQYAINERPTNGDIRLGFIAKNEGTYTIAASRMDRQMVLFDIEMNITHDLSTGGYTFNAKAGTNNNRFLLREAGNATGINQMAEKTGVLIGTQDGGLNIGGAEGKTVSIYGVDGKLMTTANGNGFIALKSGVYVAKVENSTAKISVR